METVFRVGMTVYDEVFQKGSKGEIVEIAVWNRKYLGDMNVLIVQFGCSSYTYSIRGALLAFGGLKLNYIMPVTLSTSSYTVGEIKQESTPPNVQEAIEWCKEKYEDYRENICGHYLSEKYEKAFDALNSLILLRELYNEGWKPNWNKGSIKYCIVRRGSIISEMNCISSSRVMCFKTKEIRDKFLNEQKELLEIAKELI